MYVYVQSGLRKLTLCSVETPHAGGALAQARDKYFGRQKGYIDARFETPERMIIRTGAGIFILTAGDTPLPEDDRAAIPTLHELAIVASR